MQIIFQPNCVITNLMCCGSFNSITHETSRTQADPGHCWSCLKNFFCHWFLDGMVRFVPSTSSCTLKLNFYRHVTIIHCSGSYIVSNRVLLYTKFPCYVMGTCKMRRVGHIDSPAESVDFYMKCILLSRNFIFFNFIISGHTLLFILHWKAPEIHNLKISLIKN
jgi:hypothetical protein